jgi:hypothetical protein
MSGRSLAKTCLDCNSPSFARTPDRAPRQARGSFERLTTGGCCAQVSCHGPGDGRKHAGFGSHKRVRSGHAKRSRSALAAGLLVKHTCFRPFSNGNLDWKSGFTFQIGQFWNVKPVPTQNPIHFCVVGMLVGGVRDPIQKNWIGYMILNARWRCSKGRSILYLCSLGNWKLETSIITQPANQRHLRRFPFSFPFPNFGGNRSFHPRFRNKDAKEATYNCGHVAHVCT